MWGEDIILKGSDSKEQFYYYYIYKKEWYQQKLIRVTKGKSMAFNHFINKHYINKNTG